MIHASTSCNACFRTTGAHYLNADTTASRAVPGGQICSGDFPTLWFPIPNTVAARRVPYHWGRCLRAR